MDSENVTDLDTEKSSSLNKSNANYSTSDDSSNEKKNNETRKDIIKKATEQPDLYCVRRSERKRSDVSQLNSSKEKSSEERNKRRKRIQSDSFNSSCDENALRKSSRIKRPVRHVTIKAKKLAFSSSDEDDDQDEENDDKTDDDEEDSSLDSDIPLRNKKTNSLRNRKFQKQKTSKRPIKRRQKTENISYKEKSEDETDSDDLIEFEPTEAELERETSETIERVIKSRIGKKGATGCKTALYNVEKEGDPNEGFDADASTSDEQEIQFLIKWKNWSNIHNTWESETSLEEQKVNGIKKLENFIKREEEIDQWRQFASVEDQEYFGCQQEINEDLYEQYCLVERIISAIPKGDSCDYLVKWQGLPYSECTQEDGTLVKKKFPGAIEKFEERTKNSFLPSRNCKVLKSRPKFRALEIQPDYIGNNKFILRDYQLEGLNWLLHSWCKNNGAILADEMGLGKTIQTISFLAVLMKEHALYGPFLLIVPLSTLVTWQKEFEAWASFINTTTYIGDINSRSLIRDYEWYQNGTKKIKFNVILTTYEILLKDKSYLNTIDWAVLGIDEAHRLKNDDSLLYKSLITFNTNHRLFITGTPLQNSLKELWCLLHFIMPEKFDCWEDFERRHKSADKTGFRHLHQELEPFLLRRIKKDVEKSLPAKVEQILRVEMTKIQKQYYKWVLTKNYKALAKGTKNNISGFINLVMELKKCCNHGFLIKPPDESDLAKDRFELMLKSSGKLLLLDKLLIRLKEAGHRVLIFSQMVRMLNIIAEYLQYRHFHFQRLDGTTRGDIRRQAMDHFNAEGSTDFCFLLSTRAGGLGVNLATADTVIIFDSDWNPQNDLQAMARAHRIGQKNQVSIYRLVTKNSVEEDIVERAKKKMVLDHLVIQRMDTTGRTVLHHVGLGEQATSSTPFNKEELNAILKFGAEELFKESDDEENDLQVDIDDILRLAETRNTEELKANETNELLSKFKVVSFDNLEDQEIEQIPANFSNKDWDDIIPEKDRKRIDEEEREEQLKQLKLPPRSRKQVVNNKHKNKRTNIDEDDSDESNNNSDDGDKSTKKRNRGGSDSYEGFSDSEIRKFVKSFKKFARPLQRLEDIAQDADLQDKSESDLKSLAQFIYDQSNSAIKEYDEKVKDASIESRKSISRPTFKIGNIVINARPIVQNINELESLAETMDKYSDKEKFQLRIHVKNAHFDVAWSVDDDSRMLHGVYDCGLGNWEAIKMDSTYKLQDKLLPENDMKPQARHLQTRTEYLLKILQKLYNFEKESRSKKNKSKKVKSREIIEDDLISNNSNDDANDTNKKSKTKIKNKDNKIRKVDKQTDKKKPLHFTTNQTVMINHDNLPEDIRLECKELMRPMKKSLKFLRNPSPGANERETLVKTKINLITIGNHIATILSDYKDPDKIKEWRGFLWTFVSLFTDNLEAARLHKMYKHALKMQEQDKLKPLIVQSIKKEEHRHNHHRKHHKSRNKSFDVYSNISSNNVSKNHVTYKITSNKSAATTNEGANHSVIANNNSFNTKKTSSIPRLSDHRNNSNSNSGFSKYNTSQYSSYNSAISHPTYESNLGQKLYRTSHNSVDSQDCDYQPNPFQRNPSSDRSNNYNDRSNYDQLPAPINFNYSSPLKPQSYESNHQQSNYVHPSSSHQPYFSPNYLQNNRPNHSASYYPSDRKRRNPGEYYEENNRPYDNKIQRTKDNF